MEKIVLIVTAMDGAENLARTISRETDAVVEIAHSRRAALARLRRDPVTALLLDTALPDTEMTTSEMVWQNAEGAVPLEMNIATFGAGGVVRMLRSLLDGRRQAEALGRREATAAVAQELQSTLTSLLLQSDLLLRDKEIPPAAVEKAKVVRNLADMLRARLLILNDPSGTANRPAPYDV